MPIVNEPVGILLVAAAVLIALVTWFFRDRRNPGPRLVTDDDGINRKVLEEAEKAVRSKE